MLSESSISFAEQDVAGFSDASGDRNPLHLSHEYARRTPYGQQVVFGCLGAVACLGHVRLPAGWSATSLEAEFARPMFLGVPYRVEASRKRGKVARAAIRRERACGFGYGNSRALPPK